MVTGVGQKVCFDSGEERGFASIALRKNDLIEHLDRGVVRALCFALMDKLIESYDLVNLKL